MTTLQGRVAVVTGAGSGIGRATAQLLAQRGCKLAISDVNSAGLSETTELIQAAGGEVLRHTLDVADRAAVYAYADTVAEAWGGANIVINNAGVALAQPVKELNYADWEWVFNINFWGVVHGTHAFMPQLLAGEAGHIVNISSLFGLIGVPSQAAYCASKFAVRGFNESLRGELDGTQVNITSVHPGGIDTNIAAASRFTAGPDGKRDKAGAVKAFKQAAITSPEQAAQQIVQGIERNTPRVVIGRDAKFVGTVERLLPTGYHGLLRRYLNKLSES